MADQTPEVYIRVQDQSGAWVPDDSWGYSFDLWGYWMRLPGL